MASQPSVCSAMNSASMSPFSTSRCSSPLSSARSVPGLICRNRSAFSAVAVRRGSTTISFAPALSRSAIRRNRIGWQSAMFEPMTKNRSVRSKSLVRPGRAVGAERLLVAGAGAGHAQPRVRLDVDGPQEALGQLVGQVLRLDRHLARTRRARPRRGRARRRLRATAWPPRRRRRRRVRGRVVAACRRGRSAEVSRPSTAAHHLGVRRALGAQPAEVGGVQLVACDARDDGLARVGIRRGLHFDAAADAAVRARRPGHRHEAHGGRAMFRAVFR